MCAASIENNLQEESAPGALQGLALSIKHTETDLGRIPSGQVLLTGKKGRKKMNPDIMDKDGNPQYEEPGKFVTKNTAIALPVQEGEVNLKRKKTKSAGFAEERKLKEINVNKFPKGIKQTNIDKKSKKTMADCSRIIEKNFSVVTDNNGNNEFSNEGVRSVRKGSESDLLLTKQCKEILQRNKSMSEERKKSQQSNSQEEGFRLKTSRNIDCWNKEQINDPSSVTTDRRIKQGEDRFQNRLRPRSNGCGSQVVKISGGGTCERRRDVPQLVVVEEGDSQESQPSIKQHFLIYPSPL